jgi:signal transduction histidine kinase
MTPSTISLTPKTKTSRPLWRRWFEARATERDAAFRERSIRAALAIFIVAVSLSFLLTTFIFQSPFELISLPSLSLAALAICGLAVWAIINQQLLTAGWLLISAPMLGATGLVLLLAQTNEFSVIGLPTFMLIAPLAAMILPRSTIMPISIISGLIYGAAQYLAFPNSYQLYVGDGAAAVFAQGFIILLVEGAVLRQIRVEFDDRLNVMARARQQAEQARAEAEQARQAAEQADRAKSQFLSTMSHELRTPLNAIIGYDEAMIGGMVGDFQPEQLRLLKNIQHNSRRLLALINDVLDLSKIESGSLEIYLAPMSPKRLVQETIESLRSLADEKQIALEATITDNVPEVILGDSKKTQQILVNLLSNAIKFTDQGGVYVHVSTADRETWQFVVRDTGIGMPADATNYIFEPFRQVDGTDTRKYKGTGLGLSIVKRLIESLGGSIDVNSKLGSGTSVTVIFPRVNIPEAGVELNPGLMPVTVN